VIHVCLCSHPKHETFCDELEEHFAALKRQGKIVIWQSHKILPGLDQLDEIDKHLCSADIIILFISHLFFNSDECWDIMERAMELRDEGKAHVMPVLVSPVDYAPTPVGKLQVLPRRKSLAQITRSSDRDEAYVEIVKGVREVIRSRPACDNRKNELVRGGVSEELSDDPAFYKAKGDMLFRQQQYNEAIAAYSRAISLKPDFIDAYRARAKVYDILASLNYEMLKRLSEQPPEETEPPDDIQEDSEG